MFGVPTIAAITKTYTGKSLSTPLGFGLDNDQTTGTHSHPNQSTPAHRNRTPAFRLVLMMVLHGDDE